MRVLREWTPFCIIFLLLLLHPLFLLFVAVTVAVIRAPDVRYCIDDSLRLSTTSILFVVVAAVVVVLVPDVRARRARRLVVVDLLGRRRGRRAQPRPHVQRFLPGLSQKNRTGRAGIRSEF